MDAEIEALKREREEKAKQIAEKRRQIEELKQRRSERAAQQRANVGDVTEKNSETGRSIETLVAEILSAKPGDAKASSKPSPEGPLRELAVNRPAVAVAVATPSERSLHFQQELSVASVAVEPQMGEVYERSVQTDLGGNDLGVDGANNNSAKQVGANSVLLKMAERARINKSRKPTTSGTVQPEGTSKEVNNTSSIKAVQELSLEDRKRVESHPDFYAFFERTTLLVERALGQETFDLALDFKNASGNVSGENDTDIMKHVDDYTVDRWSRGRPVTDVQFSPHQKEMFLAAYGQRANPEITDSDGCMLVWNLAMRNRPELVFSSPSAVLTARPHLFDPVLFYGGSYSGGIMLWDARAKTGPVLRTPLSKKGHSHPVMAMEQVGTQNATNLVTASNDGRLCVWSLAMMNLPQETIDLKNEIKNKRDVSVMCLSFPDNETNVLYVGSEDGSVCQVHIHGTKVGVTEVYDGHDGPVTGLHMHPHQSDASQISVDASFDLALSSSFDWSVKLWMVKQHQSSVLSLDVFDDYVYDVRWHPTHPAVFSTVDGEGHVDLWNLNQNLESPVVRCENPNLKKLALNKCQWSTDGRKLATGDSEGSISIYAVDRNVAQPRHEDFQQFQDRLRQLQPAL